MQSVRETGRFEAKFWVRGKEGRRFLAHVREAIIGQARPRIGLTGASIERPWTGPSSQAQGDVTVHIQPARPLGPAAPYGRAIDHLDEAKKR